MKKLLEKSLQKAISYSDYRTLISDLLAENKSTGPNQTEDLYNYSLLNDRRMKRLDKTIKVTDITKQSVLKINEAQTWLVLTEGWCGDAAQNIPVLNKIAEENSNIDLKLVLRDENLELMDEFLTNGGRSIPKLIVLNANKEILFTWGPRPTEATNLIADYKVKNGVVDAKIKEDLQVWYNKNKGENVQEDLVSLF
ncbi:thiol-disulfide isomerase/thioredoxin [Tenacibaculum adriaticum]|uniref:Thiol-disulfide isomerase/thioredoxin n=1 Tax=Tenacibaculum adriaticum TaxID=413713 RepID=A0A5S5DZC7_9FLAO|nr:thioredoxin family protein [Tenacibaculum adriaticum]TYQ00093.1 thiol-disulfide isomerase/thioredoxin [Tenacibaculum adriaticum]